MHCVWMAIYVGPHLLLANTQGGYPPTPRTERMRGSATRDGCRDATVILRFIFLPFVTATFCSFAVLSFYVSLFSILLFAIIFFAVLYFAVL
jgi:hypothetical protein